MAQRRGRYYLPEEGGNFDYLIDVILNDKKLLNKRSDTSFWRLSSVMCPIFLCENFFRRTYLPLTYAEAKHRCDAKQNTDPLLCAQAFLENEERCKCCQNKPSTVDNREEDDTVDYAR